MVGGLGPLAADGLKAFRIGARRNGPRTVCTKKYRGTACAHPTEWMAQNAYFIFILSFIDGDGLTEEGLSSPALPAAAFH